MATMTVKSRKVHVTYSDITLKLTPREAQTLYVVTQYIGGSPGNLSRRGDMDSIQRTLRDTIPDLIREVDYPTYHKFINKNIPNAGVNFKDDKEVK